MEGSGHAPAGPTEPGRQLILLPTLNEAEGLAATLEEIERVGRYPSPTRPQVLVVDGRSEDGTGAVATRHGVPLLVQSGIGKGAAVREGLGWAMARGFEAVGVLDADGTYPADRLPALFGLLDLTADVVLGVRRPDHAADRSARDVVHRLGNGGLNLAAAKFGGGPILDVCTGFWGVRTDLVPGLGLESDGFEIESELFVKAFRAGLHVVQIPIDYRERIGEPKLHAARDGARILLSIVRNSRRPVPVPPRGATGAWETPLVRRESLVRDVASILIALGPPPTLVYGASSRSAEADALVRALRPYGVGVERISSDGVAGPDGSTSPASRLLDELVARGNGVVTLPGTPTSDHKVREVFLDLPLSPRRLLFRPRAPHRRRPLRANVAGATPGGAFGDGRPRTLEILSGALEPWGPRRLATLLRANVAASTLSVLPDPVEAESPAGESSGAPLAGPGALPTES